MPPRPSRRFTVRLTCLLVLSAAWLLLSGCSTVDPSGYYTKGWLNPKELDEPEAPPPNLPPLPSGL